MIEVLAKSLRELGIDPSAKELADMLWLTRQMGALPFVDATQSANQSRQDKKPTQPERNRNPSQYETDILTETPSVNPINIQSTNGIDAFLPTEGSQNWQQQNGASLPIYLPTANALPNALKLARTLRPLKRRVPSPRDKVLNEAETVRQSAESDSLQLIFQPVRERWLEVVLLIDESPSMILWRKTIAEFRLLLERLGAFRTHEAWYFSADQKTGDILIYPTRQALATGRDGRKPQLLNGAPERRLFLVLSDCIGRAWYRGTASKMLILLGKNNPVGLVQMLPEYLWQQTALGETAFTYMQAQTAGASNANLQAEAVSRWHSHPYQLPKIATPILTLEEASLFAWENLLTGKQIGASPAVRIPIEDTKADMRAAANLDRASNALEQQEQKLQRFYTTASPQAQELACYIAAMPVLSLPLMRIVQQQMLKESTQAHLAEVLYSGLFTCTTPYSQSIHSDDIRFEIDEEIRYRLFDSLWIDTAINVIKLVWNKVSAFISNLFGKLITFDAFIENPELIDTASSIDNPTHFATISINLLKRLGGKYAKAAETLDKKIAKPTIARKASTTPKFIATRVSYYDSLYSQRINRQTDGDAIMAVLLETVQLASNEDRRSRSRKLITILGEAGIGKTWFFDYLQERIINEQQSWRIHKTYQAEDVVRTSINPYFLFLELLKACDRALGIGCLPDLPDSGNVTVETVAEWTATLEERLIHLKNKPLLLFFDELEWWVGLKDESETVLTHFFRIVWSMLL
ncbi:MAG TPA: ATP-binding protein, partial [Nitrosomonas sp.]|nr:ATP-binding protein [Nitrosomonas sp.]